MAEPSTIIKCPKCGHEWHTKSHLLFVQCASCRRMCRNTTLGEANNGKH